MELMRDSNTRADRDLTSNAGRTGSHPRIPATTVRMLYVQGAKNDRLLFGRPLRIETVTQREGYTAAIARFVPGARFGLDLWRSNAYGTIQWRCFVCEAIGPGEAGDSVPFVAPAARVLLQTKGAAQSRVFLAWLAEVESSGIDPVTCPRETFEAAHFRLQGSRADITPPRRLSGRP
jgi:Protein of unknown function (DUF2840)